MNPLLPHNPLPPEAEEDENYTFNSVINPLDETFSVRRAIGDIAYAYRHKLVFKRMQELTEHPVKLALADDLALSWNETSPCFASAKGLLLPYAKPLTRDERHAIYETLSDSIGPAHGIQECQGTYRKHMEARTKLYFEGLLSVPYHHVQQPSRTSTLSDLKPPLGTNDFRHWLSETRLLKRDGIDGSPRPHSRHRNARVVKQQDVDGVTDKPSKQRSTPHWVQTLDELFSAPGDNSYDANSLTDSPIVRTREATRMTALAECNTADCPLFSVTSCSSLPVVPIPSVAEIRRTGQPQFHGLPGFSGSLEVKARMPVAESHPEWPKQDPYVTHPVQQLAPSDTPRRGRNTSNNARICLISCSPRIPHVRDLDRIRTIPVTSRDARRRTNSAAGDI